MPGGTSLKKQSLALKKKGPSAPVALRLRSAPLGGFQLGAHAVKRSASVSCLGLCAPRRLPLRILLQVPPANMPVQLQLIATATIAHYYQGGTHANMDAYTSTISPYEIELGCMWKGGGGIRYSCAAFSSMFDL